MHDDEKLTCDQRRSRRKHARRARIIDVDRVSKKERRHLALLYPEAREDYWRPRTRADCAEVSRPCPFVGCRYNLYLDVQESGSIKLNFPDLEPEEMTESCALDLAENGGVTLERAGELLNVTRERIRQVEEQIRQKVVEQAPELTQIIGGWTYPKGFSGAGG